MKSGKCVYKKNPDGTKGELVGCTKGSIKKYMAALHANVKEINMNESEQGKPKSLPELNKYISKFWPKVKVRKGNGYFYIYSNDEEIDTKISGLYTSTIEGVWPLQSNTFEQWKKEIEDTLNDNNGGRGRNPVFENYSSLKLRNILKQIKENL